MSAKPTSQEPNSSTIAQTVNNSNNIRTIGEVFDKLKSANLMRDTYENFSNKLDYVKTFYASHDGGGLMMTIENTAGETIEFANVDIISEFIVSTIEKGEISKKRMEQQILDFAI